MATAMQGQAPQTRAVTGSCHCKAIRYEVKIPHDFKSVTKCNCTMCQKPGFVSISLNTDGSDFNLLSPNDSSQVKAYQWRSKDCYRYFCDKCGVQVWGKGQYAVDDQTIKFFVVNLNTVDQPQDGIDVSQWQVKYWDGLTDSYDAGLKDKPFPGGIV